MILEFSLSAQTCPIVEAPQMRTTQSVSRLVNVAILNGVEAMQGAWTFVKTANQYRCAIRLFEASKGLFIKAGYRVCLEDLPGNEIK